MTATMTMREEEELLRGIDRGFTDHTATLFKVLASSGDAGGLARFEQGIAKAVESYQDATEAAKRLCRGAEFDIMSGEERVTTGRDYGADEA
jgi:hypothetical protein